MGHYRKIGITGANGKVGRALMAGLADNYEIVPFTRRKVEFPSTIVNFDREEEVQGAFEGIEAVIHLAADPSPMGTWESIHAHNIQGTYYALEECVRAGVKRLVFASTNHTQHGNTMGSSPAVMDMSKHTIMKLTDPPNPDSLYGVSKVFGELLGKYYSQQHGVSFVGLRIGWLISENDPSVYRGTEREDYMRAMWLSHRDCVEAHRCALEVNSDFLIAYAVSNNDRRVFDLDSTAEMLGFVPKDNAETYFR